MRAGFNVLKTLFFVALMAQAQGIFADSDRVEHFKGKPAQTLEEAFENLHAGNRELAQLLADAPITAETSYQIHQLTYTLENALERIEDEMDRLEDLLEEVHLGSEANQAGRLDRYGQQYLDLSQRLFEAYQAPPAP